MSHRLIATRHLEAAKRQLEANTEETLRYACLDLRMAIECLTYDLLAMYREDVLDQTLNEWRADKILTALKEIDPASDSSPIVQMANKAGEFGAEGSVTWTEHRFESKWAKKAYNTLGRHLHERTFVEIESGNKNDWAMLRQRAVAIATEVQEIIDSTGWGLRFKQTMTIPCECGETATFQMGFIQLRSRARCSTCNANYEVWREHEEAPTVKARRLANQQGAVG